jgi:hypothetical protein
MPLWTVQPLAVWAQVQRDGAAWVDPSRVNRHGWLPPPYSWLSWQLRGRIDGSLGRFPWFAYCSRPDLRWVRHTRPWGETQVSMESEPPPGQWVAFPCWAWHEVFTGQYLALTAADARDWARRVRDAVGVAFGEYEGLLPEPLESELEASWRRLFSPALPARSWRRGDRRVDREAVVEVIRAPWVRRMHVFAGTGTSLKPLASEISGPDKFALRRRDSVRRSIPQR